MTWIGGAGPELIGEMGVACPQCGHKFVPGPQGVPVARLTEASGDDAKKPYGDVEYADPGLLTDGKKRYPLDTKKHVKAAWDYINQERNAKQYTKKQLQQVRAKIKAAAQKVGVEISDQATEALVNGKLSFSDITELVRSAVRGRLQSLAVDGAWCYCWIADLSDTDAVYETGAGELWQISYSLMQGQDGTYGVTLGDPVQVARTYAPVAEVGDDPDPDAAGDVELVVVEARDGQLAGRVVEAKGTDSDGGRVFAVQIIAYGDSKNMRRYPEAVLQAAAPLYEGAKAYDHHRTDEELRTSTIAGLVGTYRDVEATDEGLQADLHLLPSATHAAEALDAALAAADDGLPTLVGISHDVMATYRSIVVGGQRMQEATSIVKVNSADIVADPAAGGKATRMVAGGIDTQNNPDGKTTAGTSTKESAVDVDELLAALKTMTPAQLAEAGLRTATTESTTETAVTTKATTEAVDQTVPKGGILGQLLIRGAVENAGLPVAVAESITEQLPDQIRESDVTAHISSLQAVLATAERAGLTPSVGNVQVTKESLDRKKEALDAFFAGDYSKGYRSFRQAYVDFTGTRQKNFDEDFNRTILAESFGVGFSSAARSQESMDSTTWSLVLGDSLTRRMIAEYQQPNLQTWQRIVSSMPPINDFRAQRIERIGGYGTLPAVSQGAPYQPLTSPGQQEITYAISKRGGTEDVTLEMIANDDVRALQRIPMKLGLAAAQTVYRFVFDMLVTNAATSYDSTALFHTNHANTDNPAVLGQSTLSVARRKMRQQAAFGDSSDVLSIVPAFLVVPSALEEIAYQLATSAVAIPATPAGPTDTPNIHQGIEPIVVDYLTDNDDWFCVADPQRCPTIEIGFYQGRQLPELFSQTDQSTGSVFAADKVTWKIRHMYSGTVLEHRGFYRGSN